MRYGNSRSFTGPQSNTRKRLVYLRKLVALVPDVEAKADYRS